MKKKYRTKCPNPQCGYVGQIEGESDEPFVKKAARLLPTKTRIGTRKVRIKLRCPKCKSRWRMDASRLH